MFPLVALFMFTLGSVMRATQQVANHQRLVLQSRVRRVCVLARTTSFASHPVNGRPMFRHYSIAIWLVRKRGMFFTKKGYHYIV
jgi:hypothetical protein